MINFNNKKTKKVFSTAIIILLVISMVLPMLLSALV